MQIDIKVFSFLFIEFHAKLILNWPKLFFFLTIFKKKVFCLKIIKFHQFDLKSRSVKTQYLKMLLYLMYGCLMDKVISQPAVDPENLLWEPIFVWNYFYYNDIIQSDCKFLVNFQQLV